MSVRRTRRCRPVVANARSPRLHRSTTCCRDVLRIRAASPVVSSSSSFGGTMESIVCALMSESRYQVPTPQTPILKVSLVILVSGRLLVVGAGGVGGIGPRRWTLGSAGSAHQGQAAFGVVPHASDPRTALVNAQATSGLDDTLCRVSDQVHILMPASEKRMNPNPKTTPHSIHPSGVGISPRFHRR